MARLAIHEGAVVRMDAAIYRGENAAINWRVGTAVDAIGQHVGLGPTVLDWVF